MVTSEIRNIALLLYRKMQSRISKSTAEMNLEYSDPHHKLQSPSSGQLKLETSGQHIQLYTPALNKVISYKII